MMPSMRVAAWDCISRARSEGPRAPDGVAQVEKSPSGLARAQTTALLRLLMGEEREGNARPRTPAPRPVGAVAARRAEAAWVQAEVRATVRGRTAPTWAIVSGDVREICVLDNESPICDHLRPFLLNFSFFNRFFKCFLLLFINEISGKIKVMEAGPRPPARAGGS